MGWKKRVDNLLRRLKLDPLIYYWAFLKDWRSNACAIRRFRALHPEVCLPPAILRFDVYGSTEPEGYYRAARSCAELIDASIAQHFPEGAVRIFEWGCGPGRVIGELARLDTQRRYWLSGSDYVKRSVEWAKSAYPCINFIKNQLHPPLAVADETVDFAYAISVFTHLSHESHQRWLAELRRILRPGGVLLLTTHGERYTHLLTSEEKTRFRDGQLVTFASSRDGSQMYSAFHSPKFMERFLSGMEIVSFSLGGLGGQDLWTVRRRVEDTGAAIEQRFAKA
jgi:SAM-dependent methyltransferase